ncbi:Dipeptide transport ATP-binding protein DppD (TC 3.A.1.5.2) [Alloactinosynnema sp. L-07]|uniref:ABC transporter ATP-binding protein n=1 Tax=Alloactinosynnema sp. L-07 TaxID=1653480 RepID=UPI00065EF185|nr:ABC transporter ATP-binding protein [Alloactinosynnema sp. L-07]CRK57914.1 Dipeptide transport ATP-binding protein DppD (TC 3.A.1.5.2) [Alloactinosynnema sp. L-07]
MTGTTPAVDVRGLRVVTDSGRPIVDTVSFSVEAGQLLAVIGESGSGKTTTALALLGWANAGTAIDAGEVVIAGESMLDRPDVRSLRSTLVSYVPQDPLRALNPARRVGVQLAEILRVHGMRQDADTAIATALDRARLPADPRLLRRYPHQLSGGQRQRVVIAQALLLDPAVIVLDEPTTGLDAVTQREFLTHLRQLRAQTGAAMVYVTHDVAAAAEVADRVVVMRAGVIVEQGPADEVIGRPREPYTRELIAATPDPRARVAARPETPTVLRVRGLTASHGSVVAAQDVDLDLTAGRCLALVGASGSGKTTIGRCVAGLHRPDAGTLTIDGVTMTHRRTRDQRKRIAIVVQSPGDSLNPRRTVGAELARVLRFFGTGSESRVGALLDSVRLPRELADRYPAQLSGGEQQRAAIARALAADPAVLVCDEITSALDVSVQASVLGLLSELQRDLDLALLFITHDLGVVAAIADRVALLDGGRIHAQGPTGEILRDDTPHPLAERFLTAAPATRHAHNM